MLNWFTKSLHLLDCWLCWLKHCIDILRLARKWVWHVSIGHDRFTIDHDRCCIMYISTISSCAEWAFNTKWTCTLEKSCWITQVSIIHSLNYLLYYFWHILWHVSHVLSMPWIQWMHSVSDGTGYCISKMLFLMLSDESRWNLADITVLLCRSWCAVIQQV